jgi:two-component system NtrC family sensor kinase
MKQTITLQKYFNKLILNLCDTFGAEAGQLALLEPPDVTLKVKAAVALGVNNSTPSINRPVSGLLKWVTSHTEPVLVGDVSTDKRYSIETDTVNGVKTHSILAAPLHCNEAVFGALALINPAASHLNPGGLKKFADMAAQAALSIDTLNATTRQLQQAEKLSSVGRMVVTIAHELNNPLSSIVGYASLLQQHDLPKQHRDSLKIIFQQAERAGLIVKDLQTFAGDVKSKQAPTDINKTIETSLALLEIQLRQHDIRVETRLDPNLPPTLADAHQLQQVLVNLCTNAIHALSAISTDRRLTITSSRKNRKILIAVFDNGPNIPQKNLQNIFTPFFSTKKPGQGTGLGLSICASIIDAHHGQIWVENGEIAGKTFFVQLPHQPASAAVTPDPANEQSDTQATDVEPLKILAIDDEMFLLTLLRLVLSRMGHTVEMASNGSAALQQIATETFDLIICDVLMPDLTGPQLYWKVVESMPQLSNRFLFISGNTLDPDTRAFFAEIDARWLAKPFLPKDLTAAIAEVFPQTKI